MALTSRDSSQMNQVITISNPSPVSYIEQIVLTTDEVNNKKKRGKGAGRGI